MFTRRKIIIFILSFIFGAGMLLPLLVFAQEGSKDLSIQLSGVFGKAVSGLPEYIAMVYNYAIGLAVSLSIFMLMVGGFKWITAAGNPGKIGDAKNTITDAIIGLVLTLGAYLILNTINPAILSLKMPGVPKIAADPWLKGMCVTKPEDCSAGQTPINCQCVDVGNLQVGGWCLVGDLSAGDAKCAKECQGCTCNPPPPQTCIELLAKVSGEVGVAAMGGAMFIDPGSFGAFVKVMQKAGGKTAKVFYKGGKLFFRIPYTKTLAGATFAIGGAAEICRQASKICEAATEEAAEAIGLQQLEDAVGKAVANFEGTLGSCYAIANGTVQAGGFCGRDSNCASNICVPFDPDVFKKKFQAKEENWCDRFYDAKAEYLSKLGVAGKAVDWTQNAFKDVLKTVTGSIGELATVVIGCEECGTILGGMGVCSSGEVGGSCWTEKDEKGNEVIFGCRKGLNCVVSGGSESFLGGIVKACSDGSEGTACKDDAGCQEGLKCVRFVSNIKKCERADRGWQGDACAENGGCVEDKFPPKSTAVKNAGDAARVLCLTVSGEGSAGLPDYTAKKFTEHNQGKPGRCGRNGYEYGDPCVYPGSKTGNMGYCRQGLVCAIDAGNNMMRKYTEEDQKEGWWGKCCKHDEKDNTFGCKVAK